MQQIKVQCPAKINLTLKITGKRPDGFHNIESIMQTISLYDYLKITVNPSAHLTIELDGNSADIPYDESNLIYKAAKLFFETLNSKINQFVLESCHADFKYNQNDEIISNLADNKSDYAVKIYVEKNIPVAAGLAGGSTDAAGTLYGLNKILEEPLTMEELHKLCATLGSDLNFCLEGGTQMTTGRGEVLKPLPYKEQYVSLIKPLELGISAKEAYTKFANKHSASDINRDKYVNDLEWAVIDTYAELEHIKALYPDSVMSGSGSTYYQLNGDFKPADGYWIKNGLKTTDIGVTLV